MWIHVTRVYKTFCECIWKMQKSNKKQQQLTTVKFMILLAFTIDITTKKKRTITLYSPNIFMRVLPDSFPTYFNKTHIIMVVYDCENGAH